MARTETDDLRPPLWSEAMALAFIASGHCDSEFEFAQAFCEGDWDGIDEEWPLFKDFVASRS